MKKAQRLRQLLQFDRRLLRRQRINWACVAGVDEAGRGPLAGPVVASAVVLSSCRFAVPIDDSKRLSPKTREAAFREIVRASHIGIGFVDSEGIDRLGIHLATQIAMLRAVERLPISPGYLLIDGPWIPSGCPVRAVGIVGGDSKSLLIACASIVAKVVRDRLMEMAHHLYPMYGFLRHKGYGTPEHFRTLRIIGPSPLHRFSFRPLRAGFKTGVSAVKADGRAMPSLSLLDVSPVGIRLRRSASAWPRPSAFSQRNRVLKPALRIPSS